MIVVDASVLIGYLESADPHHSRATELLASAAADDRSIGASPLTLAEVLVGPARADQLGLAGRLLDELDIETVALTDSAPGQLAGLRASTRLRLPDCCVLLAAQTVGAELATFDARLAGAARDLGLAVRS